MAIYTTQVVDAKTGAPVPGAYVLLSCVFPGGGTVPWDGYSDSNGVVTIDTGSTGPVVSWDVTAAGYVEQYANGSLPSMISLVPVGGGGAPSGVNWTPVVVVGGILGALALAWYLWKHL